MISSSYVASIGWTDQANLGVGVLSAAGADKVGGLWEEGKSCKEFLKRSTLYYYFFMLSPNATNRPFLQTTSHNKQQTCLPVSIQGVHCN